MMLWTRLLNPEVRPIFSQLERLRETYGEARADSIVRTTKNLCLYPNVYLMDQFSTQIRVTRPIDVNKTEVTIYAFGPKNEPAEPRTTHFTSNLEILSQSDREVKLRFNWLTKAYRYKKTAEFFGTSFYTLDITGEQPLIREKRLVLNNDCINQVLDVYHL